MALTLVCKTRDEGSIPSRASNLWRVMKERRCFKCGKKIEECMGFVLARDFLNEVENPRELCGKCALAHEILIESGDIELLLQGRSENL